MRCEVEFLAPREIYARVREELPRVKSSLVIATALAKETRLEVGGDVVTFLGVIDDLVAKGMRRAVSASVQERELSPAELFNQ